MCTQLSQPTSVCPHPVRHKAVNNDWVEGIYAVNQETAAHCKTPTHDGCWGCGKTELKNKACEQQPSLGRAAAGIHEEVAQAHKTIWRGAVRDAKAYNVVGQSATNYVVHVLQHNVNLVTSSCTSHFQHPKATLHCQNDEATCQDPGSIICMVGIRIIQEVQQHLTWATQISLWNLTHHLFYSKPLIRNKITSWKL